MVGKFEFYGPTTSSKSQTSASSHQVRSAQRSLFGNRTSVELLRKARGTDQAEPISVAPQVVHDVIASAGSPLPSATQEFFESRLGFDFSLVRVHTDSEAARSADAVNALAYTVGRNVVFAQGHYAPHSDAGIKLLAHELTHVVQQQPRSPGPILVAPPHGSWEKEAVQVAEHVTFRHNGERPTVTPTPMTLQRQESTADHERGNEVNALLLDIIQLTLDLVGIVDPSGIADATGAAISLGRGDFIGATVSAVSILPFGDLAKSAKLPRYIKSIDGAIRAAAQDEKLAARLLPLLETLGASLEKLPLDKIPAAARKEVEQAKTSIRQFLLGPRATKKYVNPKHAEPWSRGKKGTPMDLGDAEAERLFKDPYRTRKFPNKERYIAVKDGRLYEFKADTPGEFHGYPVTGNEVCKHYPNEVLKWVAEMLGTTVKKLSQMN